MTQNADIRTPRLFCRRYMFAIYWAMTTICTVGYGDISAVSVEEKVVAMTVMLFGAPHGSHGYSVTWGHRGGLFVGVTSAAIISLRWCFAGYVLQGLAAHSVIRR